VHRGYVGLWDVTATFGAGRLASDLARRGDIHCNAVWRPDGQVLQHDDRCQSHAVAPFLISNGIELVRFDVCPRRVGSLRLGAWVHEPVFAAPSMAALGTSTRRGTEYPGTGGRSAEDLSP